MVAQYLVSILLVQVTCAFQSLAFSRSKVFSHSQALSYSKAFLQKLQAMNNRKSWAADCEVEITSQHNPIRESVRLSRGDETVVSAVATLEHQHLCVTFDKKNATTQQHPFEKILALLLVARLFNKFSAVQSISIDINDLIIDPEDARDSSRLWHSILPVSGFENVDMVDTLGKPWVSVPRPLVHTFNLLHRGVGIMVVKTKSGDEFDLDLPDWKENTLVYVHRRTDSKRIFPSLYDMFVGGVSATNEEARLTAGRELAEELGLKRPLEHPETLNGPLFQCTVKTAYNHCVVTVFVYQVVDTDIIQWQPEEVAWGNFVDYTEVECSARASIKRLDESDQWPGRPYEFGGSDSPTSKSWDYVPDGLLVWHEWQEWLQKKNLPKNEPILLYDK